MELRRHSFQRGIKWLPALLLVVLAGCKARTPGAWEQSVATRVKQGITVGGKREPNPLPLTPEIIEEGRKNFSHYCMVCHGLDGQNTGVPFAEQMAPPVPVLSSRDVQGYTDGQLKWIITNGIFPSGMPASKGILNDDEMWTIVHYIRHLPAKGSLGEPRVYNEDQDKNEIGRRAGMAGGGSPRPDRISEDKTRGRTLHKVKLAPLQGAMSDPLSPDSALSFGGWRRHACFACLRGALHDAATSPLRQAANLPSGHAQGRSSEPPQPGRLFLKTYKSSGLKPVTFARRANIRGPISTFS